MYFLRKQKAILCKSDIENALGTIQLDLSLIQLMDSVKPQGKYHSLFTYPSPQISLQLEKQQR